MQLCSNECRFRCQAICSLQSTSVVYEIASSRDTESAELLSGPCSCVQLVDFISVLAAIVIFGNIFSVLVFKVQTSSASSRHHSAVSAYRSCHKCSMVQRAIVHLLQMSTCLVALHIAGEAILICQRKEHIQEHTVLTVRTG